MKLLVVSARMIMTIIKIKKSILFILPFFKDFGKVDAVFSGVGGIFVKNFLIFFDEIRAIFVFCDVDGEVITRDMV